MADERTLTSGSSTMRSAHLTRIESFVRKNLRNPALDPEMIARHCGISFDDLCVRILDLAHVG